MEIKKNREIRDLEDKVRSLEKLVGTYKRQIPGEKIYEEVLRRN